MAGKVANHMVPPAHLVRAGSQVSVTASKNGTGRSLALEQKTDLPGSRPSQAEDHFMEEEVVAHRLSDDAGTLLDQAAHRLSQEKPKQKIQPLEAYLGLGRIREKLKRDSTLLEFICSTNGLLKPKQCTNLEQVEMKKSRLQSIHEAVYQGYPGITNDGITVEGIFDHRIAISLGIFTKYNMEAFAAFGLVLSVIDLFFCSMSGSPLVEMSFLSHLMGISSVSFFLGFLLGAYNVKTFQNVLKTSETVDEIYNRAKLESRGVGSLLSGLLTYLFRNERLKNIQAEMNSLDAILYEGETVDLAKYYSTYPAKYLKELESLEKEYEDKKRELGREIFLRVREVKDVEVRIDNIEEDENLTGETKNIARSTLEKKKSSLVERQSTLSAQRDRVDEFLKELQAKIRIVKKTVEDLQQKQDEIQLLLDLREEMEADAEEEKQLAVKIASLRGEMDQIRSATLQTMSNFTDDAIQRAHAELEVEISEGISTL